MKRIIKYFSILITIIISIILIINTYMILNTKSYIKTTDNLNFLDNDCIIVLGAGVWGENPSPMLEDRLLTSIDLYNLQLSNKIIVSGDHGRKEYDEVNVMKEYLIKHNIESDNIFMDHAGFSTYDSLYRAKEIFKTKKIIIVTQKYHLYRAIYIGKQLNLEVIGVPADKRNYPLQLTRDIREVIARAKDFFKCMFKPKPTYLGDDIPISGNGNITNDKQNQ